MVNEEPMNTYQIYIKSHTDAPDFEEEIRAYSLDEAVEYWYKQFNSDLSKSYIKEHIIKV